MNRNTIDFQHVGEIDSEVFGEPGHRTFRIRVRKGADVASLWIEKQQLQALCMAMRQIMEAYQAVDPANVPKLPMDAFPREATVDFRVARLALGWDENNLRFAITTEPREGAGDEPASFRCEIDIPQATAFCELTEQLLAAGRPICPLCLEPMEPSGHTCVRTNGHFKGRTIPDIEEDEEED